MTSLASLVVNPELITLAALFWARAVMTAGPDATLRDGDLNQRAMPNLNQGDVDALASAVESMLEEDNALRAWCSACAFRPGRGVPIDVSSHPSERNVAGHGGHPARAGPRAALAPTLAADFHARTFAYAFSPPPSPAPSRCPRRPLPQLASRSSASFAPTVGTLPRRRSASVTPSRGVVRPALKRRCAAHVLTATCAHTTCSTAAGTSAGARWCTRTSAWRGTRHPRRTPSTASKSWSSSSPPRALPERSVRLGRRLPQVWLRGHEPQRRRGVSRPLRPELPRTPCRDDLCRRPVLFNGLYRAVAAFADPVTVKKVRFVRSPDGKGGGEELGQGHGRVFRRRDKSVA